MRGDKDLRGESYIDTRDVFERISYLESERDQHCPELWPSPSPCPLSAEDCESEHTREDWDEDEAEELAALKAIEDEISRDGETMIREDAFEDYARDLAEDLHGSAIRDAQWPFTCIDWEQAAKDLKSDYSVVEFDGSTYYTRS